jgi:hypothetical protein
MVSVHYSNFFAIFYIFVDRKFTDLQLVYQSSTDKTYERGYQKKVISYYLQNKNKVCLSDTFI